MATGARPFQGQTSFELSAAILHQPLVVADLSRVLQGTIGRCLEKTPRERYQHHLDKVSREHYATALEYFQRVLDKEPNYALAYAGVSTGPVS